MTEPLTPDDLARMRERHRRKPYLSFPNLGYCEWDNDPYPCDAVRLLGDVERLKKVGD